MNAELEVKPYILMHIWHYVTAMKWHSDFQHVYISVIYTLYGYHRNYKLSEDSENELYYKGYNDILLNDLAEIVYSKPAKIFNKHLLELYNNLLNYNYDDFESCYVSVLNSLSNMMSTNTDKYNGDFSTPIEINNVIAHIVTCNNCKTVFDPYCGTSSIVHLLPDDVHFEGQDINQTTTLIARVNLEAKYGRDYGITWIDSNGVWDESHFDAVISCPPFGFKVNAKPPRVSSLSYNDYDQRLFPKSFEINKANLVISLEPVHFCYSQQYEELRRYLVDNNYLDTIIYLPGNLLYGTSIQCVLVVCKCNRKKNNTVTFINAESIYHGKTTGERTLDYATLFSIIDAKDNPKNVYGHIDDIKLNNYNLNISLYEFLNKPLLENQQRIILGNLIYAVPSKHYNPDEKSIVITGKNLSNDLNTIISNKNKTDYPTNYTNPSLLRTYKAPKGETYLLYTESPGNTKYALYSGDKDISCHRIIKVMCVNKHMVLPEYLTHLLINHPALNKAYGLLTNNLLLPITIDSIEKQILIISKLQEEFAEEKKKEEIADAQRMGAKSNVSDLEHMLGTPQHKIERIINKLERIKPDDPSYSKTVKQLKDCFDYMGRIIYYSNATIKTFNIEKHNISTFINDYVDSWKNYEGNYFEISIQNNLHPDCIIPFDETLITVMLDAILNNAGKHSFHKNSSYNKEGNIVEIFINEAIYQGKSYALLRVANNGDPLPEGYTIKDYITKGNYTAETGHTGLGGYHVFQITKGHNGFMYLDSNKIWNFIVDILLPIDRITTQDIMYYERECI